MSGEKILGVNIVLVVIRQIDHVERRTLANPGPMLQFCRLLNRIALVLQNRGMYRTLVVLSGSAAGLLFARMSLMGDSGPPTFAAADNPAARSPSLVTRTLTFLYLPVENVRLLVCPRRLSFDWSMDAVPPVTSVYDPRNALSVALYVALFAAVKRSAAAVTYRPPPLQSPPQSPSPSTSPPRPPPSPSPSPPQPSSSPHHRHHHQQHHQHRRRPHRSLQPDRRSETANATATAAADEHDDPVSST